VVTRGRQPSVKEVRSTRLPAFQGPKINQSDTTQCLPCSELYMACSLRPQNLHFLTPQPLASLHQCLPIHLHMRHLTLYIAP